MSRTVQEALAFLQRRVFGPALAHEEIPEKLNNSIRNTWSRLQHFRRPGDLLVYLGRFDGNQALQTLTGLRALGLESFEDVRDEFAKYLGTSAADITTLNDFVIGETYRVWDILFFAQVYDTRHGGILPVPLEPPYEAIFIKVNMEGGKYKNEWLEQGQRLKYYFYAIKGEFRSEYKYNQAILHAGSAPIYAFVRDTPEGDFTLAGLYRLVTDHAEPDGSKWFELEKLDSSGQAQPVTPEEIGKELSRRVQAAKGLTQEELEARLAQAPAMPKKVLTIGSTFVRNAYVVEAVLRRANGHCEDCKQPAPFLRKSDGTPYLEVHHTQQLAAKGPDTVENALALCPNCHRRRHFG